jgi:hypothetical protein
MLYIRYLDRFIAIGRLVEKELALESGDFSVFEVLLFTIDHTKTCPFIGEAEAHGRS